MVKSCLENADGPIEFDFSVGVPAGGHYKQYEDLGRVHYMDEESHKNLEGYSVHKFYLVNYFNALHLVGQEGSLLVEDDVRFRPHWDTCLQQSINEISRDLSSWVLSGYGANPHDCASGANESLTRGKFYCSYVADTFFGTQAMYYPYAEARKCIKRFEDYGYGTKKLPQSAVDAPPADLLIREVFCRDQNLYSSIISIVQHVGLHTTGLGGFHHSPTFDLTWPE